MLEGRGRPFVGEIVIGSVTHTHTHTRARGRSPGSRALKGETVACVITVGGHRPQPQEEEEEEEEEVLFFF